jgi:hypothetical protein
MHLVQDSVGIKVINECSQWRMRDFLMGGDGEVADKPDIEKCVRGQSGLKSWQRQIEAPSALMGGMWRKGKPLPSELWGLESVVSSPSSIRGDAPATNLFGCILGLKNDAGGT